MNVFKVMGITKAEEYVAASLECYERVVKRYGVHRSLADEKIARLHVTSSWKEANIIKVKTRMIITKEFILQCVGEEITHARILDVGGTSEFLFMLLGVPQENVAFTNVMAPVITEAKKNGYSAFFVKDERLPFEDNAFDYCLSLQCLEHTYSPMIQLQELKRVSRKGFFISIPYRTKTAIIRKMEGSNPASQHIFEFSSDDLQKIATHCNVQMKRSISFPVESYGNNSVHAFYRWLLGWGRKAFLLAYFE